MEVRYMLKCVPAVKSTEHRVPYSPESPLHPNTPSLARLFSLIRWHSHKDTLIILVDLFAMVPLFPYELHIYIILETINILKSKKNILNEPGRLFIRSNQYIKLALTAICRIPQRNIDACSEPFSLKVNHNFTNTTICGQGKMDILCLLTVSKAVRINLAKLSLDVHFSVLKNWGDSSLFSSCTPRQNPSISRT